MFRSVIAWLKSHPVLLLALVLGCTALPALADPPARVMRLSFTAGEVSFSPAADPDRWVQASRNRPLFIGDRVWTDRGARLELELGTAAIRAGEFTNLTVLNLDDRMAQLQLTEGRIDVRVRSLASDESFEIDTPNLAFSIVRPGSYRVEVDPNGDSTVIAIRDGRGEVYGEGNSYVVDRNQWYRFYGTALENDYARIPPVDDLDRWALSREVRHERSMSARYVSRAVIGYDDLDEYGTWTVLPDYGSVWVPRAVNADWAPYRNGHWAWVEPWGWTWIDDAPWGFAPFHYGRWVYADARWCWVPGPANVRPIYAPALVAFVGGSDFTINASSGPVRGVAWFPLAPGEVYRPPYRVTRNYFTEVNVTNTRINNTIVKEAYSDASAAHGARYRYHELPNAVTAVPVNAFVDARPVAHSALPRMAVAEMVQRAPVVAAPTVAPAHTSVVGAAPAAPSKPPAPVAQRQVVARTAPPATAPAYAPHELNVNPNNVVDASPRNSALHLRERVRVVTPSQPVLSGVTAQHRGTGNAPANAGGAPRAPEAPPSSAPSVAAPPSEPNAAPPTVTPSRRGPNANAPAAARAPASNVASPDVRNAAPAVNAPVASTPVPKPASAAPATPPAASAPPAKPLAAASAPPSLGSVPAGNERTRGQREAKGPHAPATRPPVTQSPITATPPPVAPAATAAPTHPARPEMAPTPASRPATAPMKPAAPVQAAPAAAPAKSPPKENAPSHVAPAAAPHGPPEGKHEKGNGEKGDGEKGPGENGKGKGPHGEH